VPGYGLQIPSRSQNAVLGETHIFTPALVNELRAGLQSSLERRLPQGRNQRQSPTGSAGAFDESARLGIDTNLGEWFLTDRDEPTSPEHEPPTPGRRPIMRPGRAAGTW